MTSLKHLLPIALFGLASSAFADSLWKQRDPDSRESLWSDRRAIHVGDILTVLIQEQSASNAREEFSRERETKAGANLNFDLGPIGNEENRGLDFNSNRNINTEHEGTTEKAFTTRLAAVVKERLHNGNLIIEATREMMIQDEVTTIVISGLIRPDDIRGDNTVLSENIAEAHIRYEGKGQIGDVRKRGRLGNRILDFVIPF